MDQGQNMELKPYPDVLKWKPVFTDDTGLRKLGQWLNTDSAMLGLGRVEMITWQTHQAVEKPAMVQEAVILCIFFFF